MPLNLSLEEVQAFAQDTDYTIVPLAREILSDFITPIEAMRILKQASTHCYMLESAQANETWGRYSFLGYEPKLEVTCKDGRLEMGDQVYETEDPAAYIRQLLADYRSPRLDNLPTFTGGLVGYFAYDYFNYVEPSAKRPVADHENFKDLDLMLFDQVIAFDHLKQKIILIANVKLDDVATNYAKAVEALNAMEDLLRQGDKVQEEAGRIQGPVTPYFNQEEFCDIVERAKTYIREGDIFQIVLSNYLSAPFSGSLFNTYRLLRTVNPSPYMFYFSGTDVELAGASPETLVKLKEGRLHTFPLAGTRPRGKTVEEDQALEKDLLSDSKELAEHNMLVDLGRNDLGRVSEIGSVEVEKLHAIERFSHVMHIGSVVGSQLRSDCDALDAIASVLPAGTLSGAPKIRACQLIAELEGSKRGVYGGAIGYIDFTGNMETCIGIRLIYAKNGKVFVRSGAGIVADSQAAKEYQECLNKAKASLSALELAQEVD